MSTSQSPSEPTPVYFWRETEASYGVFSQWYASEFEVEGVVYQSAEMWMMVQKARLFGDEEIARQMMRSTEPEVHKKLGRQVKGFSTKEWDKNKSRIVEEGNYHKFTKCTEREAILKTLLLTGDREIVEASPLDRIWGIGFDAKEAPGKRDQWGENLLGKAIMRVRTQLREEGYTP